LKKVIKLKMDKNNGNELEGFEGGIRKQNAWIIYLILVVMCFVVCLKQ